MNRSDQNDSGNGKEREIQAAEPDRSVEETGEGESAASESVTLTREEYEALKAEAAQAKERYLLAVADFDNYRKRVDKEKEDLICFANERLIQEILPILDNLERALSMELSKAGTESILEGVRMVSSQLHSVLGACGLKPVEAVGGPFDPRYHEAVGVLPSAEHDEGTVISELQRGYSLKGKVLRPSMVHVAGQPSRDEKGEGDN